MEQTLLESFKIAPALVALVAVVYLFIKAQQWMIKNNQETSANRESLFAETVKSMHDEHIEARKSTREMIEKNATTNENLVRVMSEVQAVLRQCNYNKRD